MKRVKQSLYKLITCLCLGVAMLLSGLFFVGCGDNPVDKLTLVADKSEIEVFVGESENVTFTLENYTSGIDTSLYFSLIDSAVSTKKSEHAEFEVIDQSGVQTVVKITGLSGGTTTLVATSNEGTKLASVTIKVRQYSSKFETKDENLFYLTKNTPFMPSEKLFNFDESATERKVTFHYAASPNGASDSNAFVKAELVQDEYENYSVVFYNEGGDTVSPDEYKGLLEGTGINIVAQYYNDQIQKTESQQFVLTVIYGFDEDLEIVAYAGTDIIEQIELVPNDTATSEDWRSKKFKVKVPHIENAYGNDNVKFDCKYDSGIISIKKEESDDSTTDFDVYDFEISGTTTIVDETAITLRVYYEIDGVSYADSGDSSVVQQFKIPVYIRIAPTSIVVNSIAQTSEDNLYNFYNNYDGDLVGWHKIEVKVYDPESSYECVKMTFDSDLVVKYKDEIYFSATEYTLTIDDVDKPIYVRGANNAIVTTTPKQFKFEIVSNYLREECVYECNYTISTGATVLNFDDSIYEYKKEQKKTGAFVSTSNGEVAFKHLIADNDFGSASVSYYSGDISAARVYYDGKEDSEGSDTKKIVVLKVVPYKEGDVTYKIMLDNGVSKYVTFRIIDTFDKISVNLAGFGNDGVQTAEKLTTPSEDVDDEMNLVVQNTTQKNLGSTEVVFGKTATIVLGSTNGTSVFDNVEFNRSDDNNIAIEAKDKNTYTLKTVKAGNGYILFTAKGESVEDFKTKTVERTAKVNFTSFVPVYSLNVKDENGENANNISLYVGSTVSDPDLQTTKLEVSVDPENYVYGFYDPISDKMVNEAYNEKYVYWTLSGVNAYLQTTGSQVTRMTYGNTYKIGYGANDYYGIFDASSNTFTINKNRGDVFTFTMLATIRQYGSSSKYFSVTIKGEKYDFVERIYTNFGENSIVFSPLNKSCDLGVYLNPSNATDTKIVTRFISANGKENDPILIDEIDEGNITQISNGINLIKIRLNQAVLDATDVGKLSGVLQIIPNAWYVNDSIISGYENSIVKINFTYADGTIENPYILSSAEDVIAIGDGLQAMNSHYRITTTIDMSAYSSKLPIGGNKTFSGSITGVGDASIIGINIKNGASNNYGLFSSISGKIENLTLKGQFNISDTSENDLTIGLLCGDASGATLYNVSAYISGGTIVAQKAVTFGGLVGTNSGTIRDMCVIFENYVSITSAAKDVKAAGIAGTSTGYIFGRDDISDRFGISAYSVYALIRVGSSDQIVPEYGNAAAVTATQSGGEITDILAGGVIFAKNAGGLVETFDGTETKIENLTLRTQIRGQNVGLVAVTAADGTLDNEFSDITIQATDDGVSTGIYASIYVKIRKQLVASDIPTTDDEIDNDKLLIANSPYTLSKKAAFATYVNRTAIDIESNPIDFEFTLDQYFGDVIFVETTDGWVQKTHSFRKMSTSFDVKANSDNGFTAMEGEEGAPANVIFAYYFQAAGYYGDKGYTADQVKKAQDTLDALNHVSRNDEFYPLTISGSDISISSNSALVEISVAGDIYIKGTGLAEIEVSSLLNKKQNEKVYLYIINYFNVDAYQSKTDKGGNTIPAQETGIFTLDGLVLGKNSEFKVYSNAGVDVLISPSYKYDNFTINENGNELDVNITSGGLVKIGNDLIQLSKSKVVSASVESSDGLKYGIATLFSDGITFTKNTGKLTSSNSTDKINLMATMSQKIDGKTYSLSITKLENVTINYYEGAKGIKTGHDNYVLTSSVTVTDSYYIDSDDSGDDIYVKKCEFVDEDGEKTGLFNLSLEKANDALTYNAKITVNRTSVAFQNRFNQNIYKDYTLKLKAKSNDNYLKLIPITLVQENVDVIAFTNYKIVDASETLGLVEYGNIIPGSKGILSVALSPVDADFDYLQITNSEINSLAGASQGTFEIGVWNNGFNAINGAESISGGIRISKANLEEALSGGYQGQIYVQYLFSNLDVEDKAEVGIDITVLQADGQFAETAKYNFYKKDDVSVSLKGFTNKQYVARGMEYELEVKAIGYEADSIALASSKPQQAAIVERDGKYYLQVTNDPISYPENGTGLSFVITITASKKDALGDITTEENTLTLTILEYVINYDNLSSLDIVSGVENGVMNIAVGDKKQLAIGFEGLIEYNHQNANVEAMISSLLNDFSKKGTWTIYTDLNQNTSTGEPSRTLPISKDNSTQSIISSVGDFNIKYLKISDLAVTTVQSHDPQTARRYFFTYKASYEIKNGIYSFTTENGLQIETTFDVYSYLRGSEESPNPIANYTEFLAMDAGGYYIQLADIHVPAEEFAPLSTAINYFDGNGYSFIFDDAKYDLGTLSSIGLFGSVNAASIIKNITIQIGSDEVSTVEFNSLAVSAINFGFVAGMNGGTITNAKVVNAGTSALLTFQSTPASEGYYFGGIAGQNSGYITHSQSHVKIESCINMGGIVGANQGSIASSMFKEGKLTNTSIYNNAFGVGGVAATNSENATIVTSYSSGSISGEKPYSEYSKDDQSTAVLTSSVPVGGFIYYNEGIIRDCYSNTPIMTTSQSAGFVFNNAGKIVRSFSTSQIINDNSAANYYFAGEGVGIFENCYYITGDINKSLSTLTHNGVEGLDNSGFKDLSKYFADYSYSSVPSYNSVWFFSDGNTSSMFDGEAFAGGRLELVSANIIATSQKEHVSTITDSDGIATYIYATVSGSPEDGSVFNPYVIYSPETMESYFLTGNKIASGNYRLVCPLDYSSNYSNTYNVEFRGNFECNNMEIKGITLTSNSQLDYAGLFGSIVGTTSNRASIMNLNLAPKEVVFNNAAEVGTLAGRIQYANLYNIDIYSNGAGDEAASDEDLVTVTGKNIIGGVVGLARDGYTIKNVRSYVGAFATNIPSDKSEIDYESENADYDNISFAGSIAGYLAGVGTVDGVKVEREAINVIGGKIGFMFGGISKNATAKNVYLKMNSSMKMKPYRYAGFIAGEIKGKLQNAYAYGYSSSASGTASLIALKPYTAVAVGGITGLLNGGSIDLAYVSQGIAVDNQPTTSASVNTINYVGGVVGQVKGSSNKLNQVLATNDLSAKNILGGLVGYVAEDASLSITEAACKASSLTLEGQNASPVVGGLVGDVADNVSLSITNAYGQANITIKTYTYSTVIRANFGGIIGRTPSTSSNSPAVIKLENIYTTSIYDITVEDKSSTDATGMVYDGWISTSASGNDARDYSVGGYYLDGDGKTGGEIDGDNSSSDQLRQINYSLNLTDDTSCTNVYNSSIYSAIESGLTTIGGIMDKGYTTLRARKFEDITINVNQNEYGTDLLSLNGGGSSNLYPDIVPPVPSRIDLNTAFEAFYKEDPYGLDEYNKKLEGTDKQIKIPNSGIIQMFKDNDSIWKNPGDTFAYLVFEEKLELDA